jgi:hypothetical protein
MNHSYSNGKLFDNKKAINKAELINKKLFKYTEKIIKELEESKVRESTYDSKEFVLTRANINLDKSDKINKNLYNTITNYKDIKLKDYYGSEKLYNSAKKPPTISKTVNMPKKEKKMNININVNNTNNYLTEIMQKIKVIPTRPKSDYKEFKDRIINRENTTNDKNNNNKTNLNISLKNVNIFSLLKIS